MADVQFENFVLQAANHAFSAVWKTSRAMKKAGWKYLASSDGTTKDTSGTAANDKWGGNADPAADTYPTALDAVVAWENLQGPTTLKLSMTAAPTGTFTPGEKVTQATSLAEGEFLGYDFDTVNLVGHAVILPRTGTFDSSHVVTGALSGATFTPTALQTYIREIVICKSTNLVTGSIYVQCICNETENSMRFSVLATQSSCTATVPPGGGTDASNNPFPPAWATTIAAGSNGVVLPFVAGTLNVAATANGASAVVMPTGGVAQVTSSNGVQNITYTNITGTTLTGCNGGSGTLSTGGAVVGTPFGSYVAMGTQVNGVLTHANWYQNATNLSHAQITATNTAGATGVSPDGSFWSVLGDTISASQCEIFGYQRCDDGEGADIDPFVFFYPSGTATRAANARQTAAVNGTLTVAMVSGSMNIGQGQSWRGFRRRGFVIAGANGGGDGWVNYAAQILWNPNTGTALVNLNSGTQEIYACTYTSKIVRERIVLACNDGTKKQRKGSPRWLSQMQGNTTFDTIDAKQKMVILPLSGASLGTILIGPLDGATTPAQ